MKINWLRRHTKSLLFAFLISFYFALANAADRVVIGNVSRHS